jgi:HK97 family phage portal protein
MMGHFPLVVYRREKNGTRILHDHPAHLLLHDAPNRNMTSMEFRQAVSANYDMFGNAFVEIARIGGRVKALNLLDSRRMRIRMTDGELWYDYTPPQGGRVTYRPEDIMHLRNFSLDGVTGLNPIEQQRNAIGMAIAQQDYGSAVYKNGGRPSGVLEHPGSLSPEAVARMRKDWDSVHSGPANSGKVALLWDGMKYNAIGLSSVDLQYIESRKYQVAEIARIYGVPPHLLADLDRATFSNVEQQSIEFVLYSLAPLCVLWEQRIKQSVLAGEPGVYAKFKLASLLRGDATARAGFYSSMVQNGIMTRDECRDLEELNLRGGEADELTVQSNMLDLGQLMKIGGKK